jgi:hypothetical protein
MEKKFILKSQLEEIVDHLMERTFAHADKLQLNLVLRLRGKELALDVNVWDVNTYDTIASKQYTIVTDIEDEVDVDDDTIGLALAKIEGRYQEAKEIVETNTPKEN